MKSNKLKNLIENIKSLNEDEMMNYILSQKDIQDYIIELNHNQLLNGYDSKGNTLASFRPYSPLTVKEKGSTVVDLYVTGQFYNTFRVIVKEKGFEIVANTDMYGSDFKDIYGDDIIGLSIESMKLLEIKILPKINKYIKDFILKI